MQPRPTAGELLAVVAEVLADEVVPALSGPVQHHARVAASLVAIVERELRLAAATDAAENDRIVHLLGTEADELDDLDELDNAALRAVLTARLRAGLADDTERNESTWEVLMASVRDDLAIARPGHDAWEGD